MQNNLIDNQIEVLNTNGIKVLQFILNVSSKMASK